MTQFASVALALLMPAVIFAGESLPSRTAVTLAVDPAYFQLEELVITAPQLKISDAIDPRITKTLLYLLQERQNARPSDQTDINASVGNLNKLTTVIGYKLKTRYTELGFLLTEGLAGVKDFQLLSELEKTARNGENVQTRAAAMVALAYTKDMQYMTLFQQGLLDENVTVRFGALESMIVLDNLGGYIQIGNAARGDRSYAVKLYAAAAMWRKGDIHGREILMQHVRHEDWFVRAMAIRYVGEIGEEYEYTLLLQQLFGETHPAVQAELASALMRLQTFQEE